MKKKLLIIGMICIAFCISSCKTSVNASFTLKSECLGIELDGSQTIKSWGKGRYWLDAAEQAKKNAVMDVLFNGIGIGDQGCSSQPLLLEVNANEKYKDYFDVFFADGGNYNNFVSLKDERVRRHIFRKASFRNKDYSVYYVVVRVQRLALEKQLIADGIIKK